MSGWRLRANRAAVAALLALPLAAQDPAAEEVSALFERGRWDLAFDESAHIESPQLRAAWRFHVLYAAGNLPAALDAARAGLEQSPANLELLHNATLCAVTLGVVPLSEELLARWRAAIDQSSTSVEAREDWDRKHAQLSTGAQTTRTVASAAERARRRAGGVVAVGLLTALLALGALAVKPTIRVR